MGNSSKKGKGQAESCLIILLRFEEISRIVECEYSCHHFYGTMDCILHFFQIRVEIWVTNLSLYGTSPPNIRLR